MSISTDSSLAVLDFMGDALEIYGGGSWMAMASFQKTFWGDSFTDAVLTNFRVRSLGCSDLQEIYKFEVG